MRKWIILALTAALILNLTGCSSKEERTKYEDAVELFESGKYSSALKLFEEVIDYKDSDDFANICRYHEAIQILSPDSSVEDGFSGNVLECTDDNVSQYTRAVALLKAMDGYKDSERMLRVANKILDTYNSETQMDRIASTIGDKFLGYLDRCTYDGNTFTLYFSEAYPITSAVLMRAQSEPAVAESWVTVRGMFTEVIFEYLPDCIIEIIDNEGTSLGKYMLGSDNTQVTILYDIATNPR